MSTDTFSPETQAQMDAALAEAAKSPEVQEAVKKSIEESKDVSMGVKEVPPKSEEVAKPRKISNMELKRMQIYAERRKRLINKGVAEDKVDEVLAQEDYAKLPLEEKFKRLQHAVSSFFKGISGDIMALRQNESVLAETMEINLRAIAKSLTKAGVTLEDQRTFLDDVQKELAEEMKKALEDHKKAQEEAKKKVEAESAEKSAVKELNEDKPAEAQGADVPPEATVFGG